MPFKYWKLLNHFPLSKSSLKRPLLESCDTAPSETTYQFESNKTIQLTIMKYLLLNNSFTLQSSNRRKKKAKNRKYQEIWTENQSEPHLFKKDNGAISFFLSCFCFPLYYLYHPIFVASITLPRGALPLRQAMLTIIIIIIIITANVFTSFPSGRSDG